MHEFSLLADLMNKIQTLARENEARRVTAVSVKLGALAHISPDHFREHFVQAARGTVADGARLDVRLDEDETDPRAQDILLESVEVD